MSVIEPPVRTILWRHLTCAQTHQRKYLDACARACCRADHDMIKLCLLASMAAIGLRNRHLLAEHRKLFDDCRQVPALKDMSVYGLDVIDGRV